LPWEQSGFPFFAAIIETTKLFLTRPREAFERSSPTIGIGRPLLYGCILAFIGNLFTATYELLFSTAAQNLPTHGAMHDWMAAGMSIPPFARFLGTILVSPFVIPLVILIGSGLTHLFLLLLGGGPAGYAGTLKAGCYAGAPLFLSVVPICGSIVALFWGIGITVIGLSVVHRISIAKAIVALLLPFLVCCACLTPVFFMAGLGHHWMNP